MQHVKVLEISILKLSNTLVLQVHHYFARQEYRYRIGQVFAKDLLVDLVIQKLALHLCAFLICELSPAHLSLIHI